MASRLVALTTSLMVAACGSLGVEPSPGRIGVPSTTQPTSSPTDSPVPTVEATATASSAADEAATLVIRAISCGHVCGPPSPGTTVVSDGRVIWRSSGPGGGVLIERTLTPAGLQLVREAVDATGLLGADGSYQASLRPGKDPPGHGLTSYDLRATQDDTVVRVDTGDPTEYEADNEMLGDIWDIPPEMYPLADLARNVLDVEAWLPSSAWADAARPYVADEYLLIVTPVPGDVPPNPDVDEIDWPFSTPIDAIGTAYTRPGTNATESRCLPVTREIAEALATAERDVGNERVLGDASSDFSYAWARGPGSMSVELRQLLPDQASTCLAGGAW
ncbi:MAG TPA: hypothetical protein VIF84_10065 [Candidatus Limnocylindrales bacterium]